MSEERAFDPIPIKVPEEEFIAALATFLFEYMDVPPDGKWREVMLHFDIRGEPGPEQQRPTMGGFMLGGRDAS